MLNEQYFYIAKLYNHLMKSVDYSEWADYLIEIFERADVKTDTLLDLGCGTCSLTEKFTPKFSKIIALDNSLQMLRTDCSKKLSKLCCSMLNLPFKAKFPLIISTFDSVNYLTQSEQIKKLFNEVAQSLTIDGIFTFDVSLEQNSIKYEKFLNRKGKFDGIKYVQKSIYNKSERMHYNFFKLQLKNGSSFEEVHKQRIYEFEFYFDTITTCGLFVSECYDAFTFDDADANSERIQFVVRRKKINADF